MSEISPLPESASTAEAGDVAAARKRPKPGERRIQILQALAATWASTVGVLDAASVLTAFVVGRLQGYARSGFRRLPTEHLEASLALML